MKRLCTIMLVAITVCLTMALAGCGGTRTKNVSAASIAQLPAGTSYEIDLTRKGTVYRFDDPGTDFNRVAVRTAAGVKTLGSLLEASKASARKGVSLGRTDEMRDHLTVSTGGTSNFDCGVFCKCDDTTDCIDLILSGKCGIDFWCSSDTAACFCTAKA